MSIATYKAARQEVSNDLRTLQRVVYEAYCAGQATTNNPADGLDHLENLANAAARTTFANAIKTPLQATSMSYFSSTTTNDLKKSRLMRSYCGFTGKEISNFVEESKEGMNMDLFEREFLNDRQKTQYKFKESEIKAGLDPNTHFPNLAADVPAVLGAVGLAGNAHITTPTEITAADLAELINHFDALGVIPPTWLQGQHYYH